MGLFFSLKMCNVQVTIATKILLAKRKLHLAVWNSFTYAELMIIYYIINRFLRIAYDTNAKIVNCGTIVLAQKQVCSPIVLSK